MTDEIGNDTDRLFISKLGFIEQVHVDILKIFKPPGHPSDLVLFQLYKKEQN